MLVSIQIIITGTNRPGSLYFINMFSRCYNRNISRPDTHRVSIAPITIKRAQIFAIISRLVTLVSGMQRNIIMNAGSTVYGCSSMTARSKWLSWAPPNFITNLETEYALDETYSLTLSSFTICLTFRVGFPGRSYYGTARN